MKTIILLLAVVVLFVIFYFGSVIYQKITSRNIMQDDPKILNLENQVKEGRLQKIVFAGGCFWCTEAAFNPEFGVKEIISGYFGGTFPNPTYEDVSGHKTDHRESVIVYFENSTTSLKKVLVNYWHDIDPTQTDGQFHDIGHQYTTAIYYFTDEQKKFAEETKKILEDSKKFGEQKIGVEILDGRDFSFYPAEEYHQDYAVKNPVRYEYFKKGSGRADFIKNNWKGDKTFENFLTTARDSVPNISSQQNNLDAWENFSEVLKEKRLTELTPIQFKVTQKEGTESPFANEYDKNYEKGIYVDIVSGEPLFLSSDKFDSGTGWPSFVKPISENVVNLKTDYYLLYPRTEVRSKIADSHLGHVFDDGPKDRGGKRYCMNSAAMKFIPLVEMESAGYGKYVELVK